jgi:hypothetical protein
MEWNLQFPQATCKSAQIDCTMSEALEKLIQHARSVSQDLEDTELAEVARQRQFTYGPVRHDFAAPIRPDGTDHRLVSR